MWFFLGLLALVTSQQQPAQQRVTVAVTYRWLATLFFAAAAATRSNGATLLLFLVADHCRDDHAVSVPHS
jgi:hypothetical protein